MRIGIDMDEVIVEYAQEFLRFYEQRTGRRHEKQDMKEFRFRSLLGVSREQSMYWVNEFERSPQYERIPLVQGAHEVITRLAALHDCYVVTARQDHTRAMTKSHLARSFPGMLCGVHFAQHFDGHYGNETKAQIAQKLRLDVVVDDVIEYAEPIARSGIPVILFSQPWNEQYHANGNCGAEIFHERGWKDVEERIARLQSGI